jgi:hypothetical protein
MSAAGAKAIRSTIPPRLDRLSWSPFHTRMVAGGIVEIVFGINAEGKSLEDITKPLTATEESAAVVAAPATP